MTSPVPRLMIDTCSIINRSNGRSSADPAGISVPRSMYATLVRYGIGHLLADGLMAAICVGVGSLVRSQLAGVIGVFVCRLRATDLGTCEPDDGQARHHPSTVLAARLDQAVFLTWRRRCGWARRCFFWVAALAASAPAPRSHAITALAVSAGASSCGTWPTSESATSVQSG